MEVVHLSNSDSGGAGRATYRIHQSLKAHGVESKMVVNYKNGDDWTIEGPTNKIQKILIRTRVPYSYAFTCNIKI